MFCVCFGDCAFVRLFIGLMVVLILSSCSCVSLVSFVMLSLFCIADFCYCVCFVVL